MTTTDGTDRTKLVNCLNANLRRATRVAVTTYEESMTSSGLQGTQFTLLSTIDAFGEVTVRALGAYLVMDDSTVTRSVALLVSRGLVSSTPGEDRRTRVIALTTAGREALTAAHPLWLHAQTRLWDRLGDGGAATLLHLLTQLVDER